jgi:IS30 family transposase
MTHLLREGFFSEQITSKLHRMKMNFENPYVCRETMYDTVYALPVGELRKDLMMCLRQRKSTRRPCNGGVDRRSQVPHMVSIHVRIVEIDDRQMFNHWDSGLIQGKDDASAVCTLVGRTIGYLLLVKMRDATATSAVGAFSEALNSMPLVMRKSMTYEQVSHMAKNAELTQKTGVAI